MQQSLNDHFKALRDKPISGEWRTEKGDKLYGVLLVDDDNSLNLKTTINRDTHLEFEYLKLYRKFSPLEGAGYYIFPYPQQNRVIIDEYRDDYYIPVYYIVYKTLNKKSKEDSRAKNKASYTFNSFLYGNIPTEHRDNKLIVNHREILSQYLNIRTCIGTISINYPLTETTSTMPPVIEIKSDSIKLELLPKEDYSMQNFFMIYARVYDLIAFALQEAPTINCLAFDGDEILLSQLAGEKISKKFSYRKILSVESFTEFMKKIAKNYFDEYDKISQIVPDLIAYYEDYGSGSEQVQLSRLFTALEQTCNLFSNNFSGESNINKKSEYQKFYEEKVERDEHIKDELKKFIKNAEKYYISSDMPMKKKILSLAQYMADNHGIKTSLKFKNKSKIAWDMRNIVIHGKNVNKKTKLHKIRQEFYDNNGLIRQDIEKLIRSYVIVYLGGDADIIADFHAPLEYVTHNLHE